MLFVHFQFQVYVCVITWINMHRSLKEWVGFKTIPCNKSTLSLNKDIVEHWDMYMVNRKLLQSNVGQYSIHKTKCFMVTLSYYNKDIVTYCKILYVTINYDKRKNNVWLQSVHYFISFSTSLCNINTVSKYDQFFLFF